MRVLIVGSLAYSLVNFRGPLLRTLVQRGHDVIACAPDASPDIRDALAKLGARYRQIPLARTALNPLADLRTLVALRRLLLEEKPERILSYTAKPVIYTGMAARLAGRPPTHAMITGLGHAFVDDTRRHRIVGALMRSMYRAALRYSGGVFFQNPDDRLFFQRLHLLPKDVPVTLINGSGVDLDWYAPRALPAKPVFLMVARLMAAKGLREYFEAARLLKAVHPQARFQLVGPIDTTHSGLAEHELEYWQKGGVIEYLGVLADVRPALAAAQVFVLPSYYREGVPRSILEAMAMGRPIVTTDAPGCRETVVHGENGFLVPVKDANALKAAMERFILNPELAPMMGAASLSRAREKYDVHKVNAVIIEAMQL